MSSQWSFGTYTVAMADAYFLTSPQYHIWSSYSELMRGQAVAEAERLIWAYLSNMVSGSRIRGFYGYNDLQHPDDILPNQRVRHDYAIYEQALYLAQTSGAIANGEETTPKWMAGSTGGEPDGENKDKTDENAYYVKITQKAKFWLGQSIYNPRIGRG